MEAVNKQLWYEVEAENKQLWYEMKKLLQEKFALMEERAEMKKQSRMSNNIVFYCKGCDLAIVRDSREHDECITKDGVNWYCGDCYVELSDDESDDED